MNCMKCGRETVSEQSFCTECLEEMKKYPVRPGTLIHLPVHKTATAVKKPTKKRNIPLEDQVRILKKRCQILAILLLLITAAAITMIFPLVEHFSEGQFKIGQNYTTVTPSEGN